MTAIDTGATQPNVSNPERTVSAFSAIKLTT